MPLGEPARFSALLIISRPISRPNRSWPSILAFPHRPARFYPPGYTLRLCYRPPPLVDPLVSVTGYLRLRCMLLGPWCTARGAGGSSGHFARGGDALRLLRLAVAPCRTLLRRRGGGPYALQRWRVAVPVTRAAYALAVPYIPPPRWDRVCIASDLAPVSANLASVSAAPATDSVPAGSVCEPVVAWRMAPQGSDAG